MKLIVGKSGTGKDFLCKAFGLKMVVSHTTRPMRAGEVNGVHKWFHENGKPKRLKHVIAETVFNQHYYWATRFDLMDKDAYIIDVPGLYCLEKIYEQDFNRNFKIVYISCSWYKRLYRLIKRDGIKNGVKRFVHDIEKFERIKDFIHTEIKC